MLEKDIESKLRNMVKSEGGRAYKFTSPGTSGVPDRLVVLPGGHVGFVELKQKGRKPTALQQQRIKELQSLGCLVTVLDDPKDIPAVISRIRESR